VARVIDGAQSGRPFTCGSLKRVSRRQDGSLQLALCVIVWLCYLNTRHTLMTTNNTASQPPSPNSPLTSGSNFDRLLSHLPSNSLAAKMVIAYHEAPEADRRLALKKLIFNRLGEIEKKYDQVED
jgi:hypothetical protein